MLGVSGEKDCHYRNPRRIGRESSNGMSTINVYRVCGGLTSAVLGTDSQNISILMLPRVVWSVTDITVRHQPHGSSLHNEGHEDLIVKSLISDLALQGVCLLGNSRRTCGLEAAAVQ